MSEETVFFYDMATGTRREVVRQRPDGCDICRSPLDLPNRPWTSNCGGTCCACMAEAGDPDCKHSLSQSLNELSMHWFLEVKP